MHIKTFFAAIAVTAAGSAAAGDTYPYVDFSTFTGTKTRAQVQAELQAAAPLSARLPEFVDQPSVATGKTRAEVRAELERDYAQGNRVAVGSPEFVDFRHVASARSREDVRREAIEAARAPVHNASAGG